MDFDDKVLNVSEPRDAFLLMLLERVNTLEDKLNEVEKINAELEKKNQQMQSKIDELERFQVSDNVKTLTTYQAPLSRTFFVRVVAPGTGSGTYEQVKNACEQVMKMIYDKLGPNAFVTLTCVAKMYEGTADIYLNMKNRCFVYQVIRLLSSMEYPTVVYVNCDMVDRYMLHVLQGCNGEFYSYFDSHGKRIPEPSWNAWSNMLELCVI
jgi:hypothetical protein